MYFITTKLVYLYNSVVFDISKFEDKELKNKTKVLTKDGC